MRFDSNIPKDIYVKFYNKNDRTFMQSYEWGLFNKECRNQIPYYVGLFDDNNKLVAATLLLQKKLLFGFSYFYAPRGFLINYNDKELLKEFTFHLKKFIIQKKGIFLRQDPEIIYHEIDLNGNKIDGGNNNYDLFNYLKSIGYKHTGFTKEFESTQPRFTFRINLKPDFDTIKSKINKSINRKINKTFDYDMIFRESNDSLMFYNLIQNNSEKDNFNSYSKQYYEKEYELLGSKEIIKIFELVINPKKIYQETIKNLKELNDSKSKDKENNINRQTRIKASLEKYKDKDELVLVSQICALTRDTIWTLYIGNNDVAIDLYAVNRMYYEIINYAKNTNRKYLDLFGTIGSTSIKHKQLVGIHNYKKNYGGEYTEFIGEFDLISNKIMYFIFTTLIPLYRKIMKKINRIKMKKSN